MDPIAYKGAIEALYSAGYALYTNERPKDALDIFRMLLLAAPSDERGWLGLGACHEDLGQTDIAISLYGRAKYATGPNGRIELAAARAYRTLGDVAEMNLAYERARELVSDTDADELIKAIDLERGRS